MLNFIFTKTACAARMRADERVRTGISLSSFLFHIIRLCLKQTGVGGARIPMNNENVTYLTKNGLSELEAEVHHLINVRRAEVADRLHQAQEDGDLLENAEYEAAKNEQSFVEGRIADIQTMLSKATVIKKGMGKRFLRVSGVSMYPG